MNKLTVSNIDADMVDRSAVCSEEDEIAFLQIALANRLPSSFWYRVPHFISTPYFSNTYWVNEEQSKISLLVLRDTVIRR